MSINCVELFSVCETYENLRKKCSAHELESLRLSYPAVRKSLADSAIVKFRHFIGKPICKLSFALRSRWNVNLNNLIVTHNFFFPLHSKNSSWRPSAMVNRQGL